MPNNNDPNQSGKGPANTVASVGAEHLPAGMVDILNKQKSGVETLEQRHLADRLYGIEQDPTFIIGRKHPGEFANISSFQDKIDKLEADRLKISKRQEMISEAARDRNVGMITNHINKGFASSTINGQVEARLSSHEIQRAVRQQAGSMSPQEVYHEMHTSKQQLSGYEKELQGIVKNKLIGQNDAVDSESVKRMNEIYGKRDELINRRATLTGIGKFHKEQGRDPMSQTMDILQTQKQAESVMSKGGAGQSEAKEFLDILKKLNEVVDSTSQEFKDLSGSLDTAKAKLREASSEGNQKTWGVKSDTWKKALLVGEMVEKVGDATVTMGVAHRIQDRQNIAGMAGLANSKYENYVAARHGNIAAQLASKNWGASEEFGSEVKGAQMAGETLQTTGKVVKNVAKTALAVGARAALAATLAEAAVLTAPLAATGVGAVVPLALGAGSAVAAYSAVNTAVDAVADTAVDASSQIRGLKTAPAYINAVASNQAAFQAINAIPAQQMQGLRDFYVGSGNAAMGMGSKSSAFLNEITGETTDQQLMQRRHGDVVDKTLLEKMADASISPEEMAQMAELGNQTVGSQFNTNQVFAGRKYEKASLGSKEINLQRMGQLAEAGSNNPQAGLESVMASAMTKGLDGSKALGMMVSNTAALVESGVGARFGLDTAAVTAAALASYAHDDPNENKEFALKQAKTAEDVARSAETNVSTTYSGMINTSRLGDRLGLGTGQQMIAGQIESATWKALSNDADAVNKLQDLGQGRVNLTGPNKGKERTLEEAQAFAKTMLDINMDKRIESEGVGNALFGGVSPELRKKLKAGTLTRDDGAMYDEMTQLANFNKLSPEVWMKSVISGNQDPTDKTALNTKLNPKTGAPLTPQEQTDALKNSGKQQEAQSASAAAELLKTVGGAMKQFLTMTKDAATGGVEKETEAQTMAGKAADNFKLGAEKFGPAVDKLDTVLNNIIKQSGMKVPMMSEPDPLSTNSSQGREPNSGYGTF